MSFPFTLAQQEGDWLIRHFFRSPGANNLARETDTAFTVIFVFCIFWFVLLMGLMFYWVVKYRRRPGVPVIRSPHHNTPLELAWTILPSLFLGYLFYVGFKGYIAKLVAPTNAEVIDVQGRKWVWTITYANGVNPQDSVEMGGNVTAPIIIVPVGRPVQFRMSSSDVLHSFWIPDFRYKFDVMPNRYTSFWIEAEKPGEHWVFCAEYCGALHSEMSAIIRAVPAEEYDAQLAAWFNETGDMAPWERGQRLVNTRGGCAACHSIDGSPGIGPTWLNAWGSRVEFTDGGVLEAGDADAWDNYVIESIINPNAKIHAGYPAAMTPYAGVFSEGELNDIVAYMRSLSDKAPQPETPPAE